MENSPKVKKAIDEVFKELMAMSEEEFEELWEEAGRKQKELNASGELSVGQMVVELGLHEKEKE